MIVELANVGFINKGAELMLLAMCQEIRSRYSEIELVITPGKNDYLKRAESGLYQKAQLVKYKVDWGSLWKFIPSNIRLRYGIKTASEIDVILDAAGFAYGDQWGHKHAASKLKRLEKCKKNGGKIVLMPQAFGPFTDKKLRGRFRNILSMADLVFARDPVSYQYLVDIVGERDNILIAPDFTPLIEGKNPDNFNREENRFCIVPNSKMINKMERGKGDYLSFLTVCAEHLFNIGAKPFFLIHEGEGDVAIARDVQKRLKRDIEIIRETDSLKIKGIIGICDGMIGSRFHGLVSALSQGVPVIATGWSHKYKMLLDDYNFPQGLISLDIGIADIKRKIDELVCCSTENKALLLKSAKCQKDRIREMWDLIFSKIII